MPNKISRIVTVLIIILLLLVAAFILLRLFKPATLNNPESIVYDEAGQRFLISNKGNGQIISLDESGKYQLFLKEGLTNPRGMKLLPPLLYVTDNTAVQVIDLEEARIIDSITIPGSIMLNDIESDHRGLLYVSDSRSDRLYIVDPSSKSISSVSSDLMAGPNGIVYDYPRRQMLIVGLRQASPILAYNIESGEFSVFRTTLYDSLDGIAIDELGRIYFSSWGEEAIFMIPQEQNRTLLWQEN
ncbi:MAG: SMP-30/gluconolactonase/LRE family protein, partial [Candidatus Syntrophosphaera sp.]|nr:SMP-30/gluconolactonase/LRE family protein [Candidatus Syntrophosphaera sp.]